MNCPEPGSLGSIDYWLYRVSVALASVPFIDFFNLHEASQYVYLAFNALVVIIGFLIAEVAFHLLDTADGTDCLGKRPVRLPQFDTYAVSFYFTLVLVNGLIYKSRWNFGWMRIAYIVLTVALTPIGLRRLSAASVGEMYLSAMIGALASALVFVYFAFVSTRLADVYALEQDENLLSQTGVHEFRRGR